LWQGHQLAVEVEADTKGEVGVEAVVEGVAAEEDVVVEELVAAKKNYLEQIKGTNRTLYRVFEVTLHSIDEVLEPAHGFLVGKRRV
jgi:tRNA U54 and U55 pseudouridine synthase Pus10